MKNCRTWKIIVCALLCVFPVDSKGKPCSFTYLYGGERKQCEFGCYLKDAWCYRCKPNCVLCSSKTYCAVCKSGYYGPTCDYNCDSCRNGSCTYNGCTHGCALGFYLNATNSHCRRCPNKCVSCNSYSECTHCINGRTDLNCDDCNTGYYLNKGQCIQCNPYCLNDTCLAYTDDCEYGCQDGWTGSKCTDACAKKCVSCQQYNNSTCLSCPFDHYGTSCESKCSSNCASHYELRQCSEINGNCNNGCADGWAGSKCTERCELNCNSCDAQNKTKCNTCKAGIYGKSCEKECSLNCVKTVAIRQCRESDGQCTDGCVVGWSGSTCSEHCSATCTSCQRQNRSACISCKPGYYGPSCNIECNENCSNMIGDAIRQCHQDDGTCLDGCMTGYKGDQCDMPCNAGCHSNCNRNTDSCQPCKPGYFGLSCQHLCNATCYDPGNGSNVCDQHSGDCLFDCPQFQGSLDGGTQNAKTSVNVAVIGGTVGSVVMLALVVAAVLVFMYLRKRRRQKTDPEQKVFYDNRVNIEALSTLPRLALSTEPVTIEDVTRGNIGGGPVVLTGLAVNEPENNVEVLDDESKNWDLNDTDTPKAEDYYNIDELTRRRVKVDNLRNHVALISAEAFEKEFKMLPIGLTRPYDDAVKSTNVSKNRYKGIYPYDSTRVKLTGNGGDYINASYIQGFDESKKTYIASLGPTEKFMKGYETFWEMVWQEKVDKIVMLTNFIEETKMKCEKYWPEFGEHKTYGDINVHCMSGETYADFTVTKLTMKKNSKVSSIHHFHFTAWPDQGTPENVVSLVDFRESVELVPKITGGPIIVHCSAGIGRTGTYIALDILTREGQSENYVDVYGCVLGLRGQRVLMVQNVEQYRFLHNSLSHALTSKCDQIASTDFCTVNMDEIQEQFKILKTVHVLNGDEENKAIEKNRKENYKNRKDASIPGDAHRPRLFKYNQNSKSDYINAIYVDSYKDKNRYIIAQTPLSETVEDFLGLVLQANCSCIISLDPLGITSKQIKDIGDFLPDVNHELYVGKIKVKCVQRETTADYILSKLTLGVPEERTEEPTTILHYQYTEWPKGSPVPSSTGSFLNLVQLSSLSDREPNMPLKPVIIHCLAGGDRSGLFPVVSNILEKINSEQQASIVNVVSQVRARRQRAIPNKEQLNYCYELASLFVENNNLYSNL